MFGNRLETLTVLKTAVKMAGVAGLEPVTSAVTGQRSNQLSYTPVKGNVKLRNAGGGVKFCFGNFVWPARKKRPDSQPPMDMDAR